MKHDVKLSKKLEGRIKSDSLRSLEIENDLIDFCSNDYLGFARSKELAKAVHDFEHSDLINLNGSGASRLINANNSICESIELKLSEITGSQASLLFNSGYNSNLSFFSCVPQRGDVVLFDEYAHASIRDGVKMGLAQSFSFKHNNLADLQKKTYRLEVTGSVFVVVESIYSMDGDSTDLLALANLCEDRNWNLVVDEAHAFGLYGKGGGKISELGLEEKVYARIVTFGKALGCHGAAICGSRILVDYLVNFARPMIYTTMMSIGDQKSIYCALGLLAESSDKVIKTSLLVDLFKSLIDVSSVELIPSESCIQSVLFPGNKEVKIVEQKLRKSGFHVKAILSPTVPEGKERIRLCFHYFNTKEQVKKLVEIINNG